MTGSERATQNPKETTSCIGYVQLLVHNLMSIDR